MAEESLTIVGQITLGLVTWLYPIQMVTPEHTMTNVMITLTMADMQ